MSCPEYHFTADLGEKYYDTLNKPGQNNFQEQTRIQVTGCPTTAAHSTSSFLQAKTETSTWMLSWRESLQCKNRSMCKSATL